jgi:hypothetical protein
MRFRNWAGLCLLFVSGLTGCGLIVADLGGTAQLPEIKWDIWDSTRGWTASYTGDATISQPRDGYIIVDVTASSPSGPQTLTINADGGWSCQTVAGDRRVRHFHPPDQTTSQTPISGSAIVLESISLYQEFRFACNPTRPVFVSGSAIITATASNFAGRSRSRTLRITIAP